MLLPLLPLPLGCCSAHPSPLLASCSQSDGKKKKITPLYVQGRSARSTIPLAFARSRPLLLLSLAPSRLHLRRSALLAQVDGDDGVLDEVGLYVLQKGLPRGKQRASI